MAIDFSEKSQMGAVWASEAFAGFQGAAKPHPTKNYGFSRKKQAFWS